MVVEVVMFAGVFSLENQGPAQFTTEFAEMLCPLAKVTPVTFEPFEVMSNFSTRVLKWTGMFSLSRTAFMSFRQALLSMCPQPSS